MEKHRFLDSVSDSRRYLYLTWFVIAAMVFFYSVTIREGHNWNGDFAQFVHHAKNISEGNNYQEIHYIVNPYNWVAPNNYPPVVPALLAPIYFLFGLNLTAMKLLMIACFATSLIVINKVYKSDLPTISLLVLTICMAFNPYYWDFKDRILSDFPFLLFSFLSLLLLQRSYVGGRATDNILIPVVLGVTMYLTYGTREIGIVLPLTVLTFEVINFRSLTRCFVISTAVFSLLAITQYYALQSDYFSSDLQQQLYKLSDKSSNFGQSHIHLFALDVEHITKQIRGYYISLQTFFFFPITTFFSSSLFYSTCLLSVIGFYTTVRKRITVIDIYVIGYIAILLLFTGYPRPRYLMPILPFFFYYTFIGIQTLRLFGVRHIENIFIIFILFATITSYSQRLATMNYYTIEGGIKTKYATEMFDFISSTAKPNDVIIFRKPRILALFTGRDVSIYPKRKDPDFFIRFLNAIEADYIVYGTFIEDYFIEDQIYLRTLINQRSQFFSPVFQNEKFVVYRYKTATNPKNIIDFCKLC